MDDSPRRLSMFQPDVIPDAELTPHVDPARPGCRSHTISLNRLSRRAIALGRSLYPEASPGLPVTREECEGGPRPCPMVSCRHHLYLDVNERTGSIKVNRPALLDADGLEDVVGALRSMPDTCELDVADRGGLSLEEVGEKMNLTRERIRQLERRSLAKLRAAGEMAALTDHLDDE